MVGKVMNGKGEMRKCAVIRSYGMVPLLWFAKANCDSR